MQTLEQFARLNGTTPYLDMAIASVKAGDAVVVEVLYDYSTKTFWFCDRQYTHSYIVWHARGWKSWQCGGYMQPSLNAWGLVRGIAVVSVIDWTA